MEDEEFTISKQELIEILTKSEVFNAGEIEVVLSRDGLKGVLSGMIVEIDNSRSRANHYKEECSMLRDRIHDLESLIDKYEEMVKSDMDRWLNM